MQDERTWQLELSQSPATAEVVLIFIYFTKARTIFRVFVINTPVVLGAMSGPPAVWTFEADRPRLGLGVSMYVFMMRDANRTWCQ
jgi:hypothetical protein